MFNLKLRKKKKKNEFINISVWTEDGDDKLLLEINKNNSQLTCANTIYKLGYPQFDIEEIANTILSIKRDQETLDIDIKTDILVIPFSVVNIHLIFYNCGKKIHICTDIDREFTKKNDDTLCDDIHYITSSLI